MDVFPLAIGVFLAVGLIGLVLWGLISDANMTAYNAGRRVGFEIGVAESKGPIIRLDAAVEVPIPDGWGLEHAGVHVVFDDARDGKPPAFVGRRYDVRFTRFVPADNPK